MNLAANKAHQPCTQSYTPYNQVLAMTDLLSLMSGRGFTPRRCSSVDGGEYSSACPVCGDGGKGRESDRFHIWPAKETGGMASGRYWCRQCGVSGDSISFLQEVDGLSFRDACNELGIALQGKGSYKPRRYQPPPAAPQGPVEWQPRTYAKPSGTWQEKAGNLLADCQARLANEPGAIAWLEERGLTRRIIDAYGLGYNLSSRGGDRYRPRSAWGLSPKKQDGKDKKLWIPSGWVLPCFNKDGALIQLRIRRRDEDIKAFCGQIKYLPVDGSSMAAMVLHPNAEVFVVVESGFEALLIAGTMHGKIGAITTWNSSARPDVYAHSVLKHSALILGGLDYDQGGDREQEWWRKNYKQYRRLPALPNGAKDPGDAFKAGVDLHAWIVDGLPRGLRLKLGFDKRQVIQPRQKKAEQPPEKKQETAPAEVIEVELTDGLVIYVTNDRQKWRELTDQGKPVFSQNELARLKEAIAAMGEEERLAAARRAIEVKQAFGGYVRAGRRGGSLCPPAEKEKTDGN